MRTLDLFALVSASFELVGHELELLLLGLLRHELPSHGSLAVDLRVVDPASGLDL